MGDNSHPGQGVIVCRRNRKGLDVIAPGGEQSRDPGERARLVLNQQGKYAAHRLCQLPLGWRRAVRQRLHHHFIVAGTRRDHRIDVLGLIRQKIKEE